MKRIALILNLILLLAGSCWAAGGIPLVIVGGSVAPPAGDTLLFSYVDSDVSWDSTPATEDCDGYDTDDDWCDQDSTTVKVGTYSLGVRGGFNSYVLKQFTETSTEFYGYLYFRTDDNTHDIKIFYVRDTGNANSTFQLKRGGDQGVVANCNSTDYDAGSGQVPQNTWVLLGFYYKEGTSSDGTIRVWVDANDDGDFDTGEIVVNQTGITTTSTAAGSVRIGETIAGGVGNYDNFYIYSGDPSWPTS